MKPAACNLLLWLWVLICAASAHGAQREIHAHGSAKQLWVADVTSTKENDVTAWRTVLMSRGAGDGSQWTRLAEIPARAIALANRGDELLVVLDTGHWRIVARESVRSGTPLPAGGHIVAITADIDTIWALARVGTALVTTREEEGELLEETLLPESATGLFSLERGRWSFRAALPEKFTDADVRAMTIDDRGPVVAIAGDGFVNIVRFGDTGWSSPVPVAQLTDTSKVSLMKLRGRSILAVLHDRRSAIFPGGERWSGPVELEPTERIADWPGRTVTAGLEQIRLILWDDTARLAEQPYGVDGRAVGDAMEARLLQTPGTGRTMHLIQVLAMVVLLFIMVGTLRRRADLQKAAERREQLDLAPLSMRFAGGLIDAAPLLLAILFVSPQTPPPNQDGLHITGAQLTWLGGGLALYLLHTSIMEMIWQRSLGKLIFKMRVVTLDGAPPRAGALLSRNLLRILDVLLLFPLTLMVFMPLRQRLGDLAAGTLVVRDGPKGSAES